MHRPAQISYALGWPGGDARTSTQNPDLLALGKPGHEHPRRPEDSLARFGLPLTSRRGRA